MAPYVDEPGLRILWGDLANYSNVLAGVRGADIVLHVGGLVSPRADHMPELTRKVNLGGIRNIIRAIREQPRHDQIRLVYIGTVAQTGDRNPPVHWGRVGDPIQISIDDIYAVTKTIAEREVIESGLRYWVSLRQTAIAHWNLLQIMRGPEAAIAFHQPINGVFEWVTVRDAGRLLANVCEPDVPEEFWNNIYNVGGGESCRVVNHEFMQRIASIVGIDDCRRIFEPNWFATRNFHGQWYEDSDRLEKFLRFRRQTLDDYVEEMRARVTPVRKWMTKLAPAGVIKSAMRSVAERPDGTLHWLQTGDEKRIAAFFGCRSSWEKIPGWDTFELAWPSKKPLRLNHGYDETKACTALAIEDMRQAAQFRGGECLSGAMLPGDLRSKLAWRCAFRHQFEASPMLVLRAGHWCPECLAPPWHDQEIASRNPFFAQVWHAHHRAHDYDA